MIFSWVREDITDLTKLLLCNCYHFECINFHMYYTGTNRYNLLNTISYDQDIREFFYVIRIVALSTILNIFIQQNVKHCKMYHLV